MLIEKLSSLGTGKEIGGGEGGERGEEARNESGKRRGSRTGKGARRMRS